MSWCGDSVLMNHTLPLPITLQVNELVEFENTIYEVSDSVTISANSFCCCYYYYLLLSNSHIFILLFVLSIQKRLAKEARAQEIQAKNASVGKKVKEPPASKTMKSRGEASFYKVTCKVWCTPHLEISKHTMLSYLHNMHCFDSLPL